ncbi:TPM domain-containing protein [Sphingobium nicotianae]|uniref:TPM domain-containing protein n=1 Tax=Sphingobium nicotianae TaxID=2782607 RepID=A0A9X1IRE0_9SPHN|nr:TPM domain-containing protein [Sphingobium nicotianae]MBT2187140.1 TPM domain-containing protein [Sphingobium nicotianae]
MTTALRRTCLILLATLLLALRPDAALAQTFPALTGRVVDNANLLDPATEQAISQKSEELERTTGRQLVVATVPSLDGYDVSDYGYRLGRAWGLGEKDKNNGVLLLIAPNERRLTIQVGYGLEPVFTDALSGRIIRDIITPMFKAGDFPGGISAGVDEIVRIIQLPPDQQRKLAADAGQQHRTGGNNGFGAILVVFFVMFFVVLPLLRGARGGRRYRGGISPVVVWGAGEVLRSIFDNDDRHGGGGWGGGGGFGGGGGGGGFSGGGGSFGGGGASGGW